jgi:hypothetical protein
MTKGTRCRASTAINFVSIPEAEVFIALTV